MGYITRYTDFLQKHANVKKPLKVVCDVSNGTTGIVLRKLNIHNLQLILINEDPDPDFPAHGPNPLAEGATEMLSKKILETGADFGVVFDSDGDRAFFLDDQGKMLPSFVTAAIWFSHKKPPFVTDELDYLFLTTTGIFDKHQIIPSRVGTIFIKSAMQKQNAELGAEFSEHFYFREFFGLDSGIFSMIYTANVLSAQEKKLSQLHQEFEKQHLASSNINLRHSDWTKVLNAIKNETAHIARSYHFREGLSIIIQNGWINIRPSHTETLIRITVGHKTQEGANSNLEMIRDIIETADGRN